MYRPDRTDWRIIALLNQDGRMSSAEISRQLGDVSARTVTNRIDALVEHGIINIRAIINPAMVGYSVLADVFIEVESGTLRKVSDHLAGLPQISYLACATGNTDIILSIRAPSIEELYNFVIEEIGKIPGIRHTKTYLLPLNIKATETWIPPDIFNQDEDNKTHHTQGEQSESKSQYGNEQ